MESAKIKENIKNDSQKIVDDILAAYDKGFDRAIDIIKEELDRRIKEDILIEQKTAYRTFLSWIKENENRK